MHDPQKAEEQDLNEADRAPRIITNHLQVRPGAASDH